MTKPPGFMDKFDRKLVRGMRGHDERRLWLLSCADAIEEQGCTCTGHAERYLYGEGNAPRCPYCRLGFGEKS